MRSWTDPLRFAFQPVVNLTTGPVAGLEILARPETGDVLAEARSAPELDCRLAVSAIRLAARRETLLPLLVNDVFAGTLADLGGLPSLHDAVRAAGRLPWEVTLDLCPPYTHVPQPALLEAVAALRGQGFRTCADGVGDGDVPLRLLSAFAPGLVKLDASLLTRPAGVRSMRTLCDEMGALLAVEGVETDRRAVRGSSGGRRTTGAGRAVRAAGPLARLPACPPARRGRPRPAPFPHRGGGPGVGAVGARVRPARPPCCPPTRPRGRCAPC